MVAAATSLSDERERCSGCGLRPDQFHTVEAALDRCPGCEARARTAKQVKEGDVGLRTVFAWVSDARDSIWAKYTQRGAQWAKAHRLDPEGAVPDPAELGQ